MKLDLDRNGFAVKRVGIVFFSGTGGTKRSAAALAKEAESRGIAVRLYDLGVFYRGGKSFVLPFSIDLLLLLFPVYAFGAPSPVLHWLEQLPPMANKAVVVSVSGGGEIWPNLGCRNHCCRILEEKGYQIIYDTMICMPCNCFVAANDHVAMHLLAYLPVKAAEIWSVVCSGGRPRHKPYRALAREAWRTRKDNVLAAFSHKFTIGAHCNGCGWCERHCPVANITIEEGRPHFSSRCSACLACIYGCPRKALSIRHVFILKQGYDLKALEDRMRGMTLLPVEKCCKGILWLGVKRYLLGKA